MDGLTKHIIPLNDGSIHCAQKTCFCNATPIGDNVVVHHAQDCREAFERRGKSTLNGWATIGEQKEREK